VVIDQINIGRVFTVEDEHQPPIARNPDRSFTPALALELMQP